LLEIPSFWRISSVGRTNTCHGPQKEKTGPKHGGERGGKKVTQTPTELRSAGRGGGSSRPAAVDQTGVCGALPCGWGGAFETS